MKRICLFCILTAVFLLSILSLNAQTDYQGTCLSQVLNKWDAYRDVIIQGNYAYLLVYSGVSIVDISNPANPHEVSFYCRDNFYPTSIAMVGDYLYLGNYYMYSEGLPDVFFSIINISNPLSPAWVTDIFDGHYYAGKILIEENCAYILEGVDLIVYDVSVPANPIEVGEISNVRYPYRISGDYLYFINQENAISYYLKVYNISNMQNPQFIGLLSLNADVGSQYYQFDIVNNYIYLALYNSFKIVNVTYPVSPQIASSTTTTRCTDVKIAGNYAYINEDMHLHVVDIQNPVSPFIISSYDSLWIESNSRIAVSQDYAYFSSGYELQIGLNVINIANPNNIYKTGSCYQKGEIVDVEVEGNRAYVLDYGVGLHMFDVQNPANPVELGCYNTDEYVKYISVSGNYALLTIHNYVGNYEHWSTLRLIDISNPTNPIAMSDYIFQSIIGKPDFINNYIYVSNGFLDVIDVSNPYYPHLECIISSFCGGWVVFGNYAYFISGHSITIVDIANHFNPQVLGTYTSAYEGFCGIDVSGNNAYLLSVFYDGDEFHDYENHKLEILNVTNPSNPYQINEQTIDCWFAYYDNNNKLMISDGYAFYLGMRDILGMVYVRHPMNIQNLQAISPCINSFDIEENYAYLANDSYFAIYDFSSMVPNADETLTIPELVTMAQNYPNPFNLETEISYSLAKSGKVNLSIYNTKGQLIKQIVSDKQKSGSFKVKWDGTDNNNRKSASGLYFYRLDTDKTVITKKCLLMK